MPVLAHALHAFKRCAAQAENGTVVARAVGLEERECLDLLKRDERGVLQVNVHVKQRHRRMLARVGAHILIHARAEGGNVFLLDGEARSQLMPAEAHQKIGAGFKRVEEVEAAVAAARALTGAAEFLLCIPLLLLLVAVVLISFSCLLIIRKTTSR